MMFADADIDIKKKIAILKAFEMGGPELAMEAAFAGDQEDAAGPSEQEDDSVIEVNGKRMRLIQIDGDEDSYAMDDDGQIFTLAGDFVGAVGDEDNDGE